MEQDHTAAINVNYLPSITTGYNAYSTGNTTWTTTTINAQITEAAALRISLLADGHILVDAGIHGRLKIPPSLFKDLFAFAEMGLLEKLCPEEPDDAK